MPSALDDAIGRIAGRVPPVKQARALEELFDLFTSDRSRLRRTSYLDVPRLRDAYLRYHLPLNYVRAAKVLDVVRRLHPEVETLTNVVDLGAGPGSASLATLFSLSGDVSREFVLTDRSRAATNVARRLLEESAAAAGTAGVTVRTTNGSLVPAPPKVEAPSLVWLAMVLNELRVGERGGPTAEAFAAELANSIPPGSTAIILEPAQRGAGRNLLRVHDVIASSGRWRIVAPCTHDAPCPLLEERARPWCHFHFEWNPPAAVRRAAAPLGLVDKTGPTRASFSFLAIERVGSPVPTEDRGRGRVIGDPMRVQGGERGVYVCRRSGRELWRSPNDAVRRGDVVSRSGKSRLRIEVAWSSTPTATTSPRAENARPAHRRKRKGGRENAEDKSGET